MQPLCNKKGPQFFRALPQTTAVSIIQKKRQKVKEHAAALLKGRPHATFAAVSFVVNLFFLALQR